MTCRSEKQKGIEGQCQSKSSRLASCHLACNLCSFKLLKDTAGRYRECVITLWHLENMRCQCARHLLSWVGAHEHHGLVVSAAFRGPEHPEEHSGPLLPVGGRQHPQPERPHAARRAGALGSAQPLRVVRQRRVQPLRRRQTGHLEAHLDVSLQYNSQPAVRSEVRATITAHVAAKSENRWARLTSGRWCTVQTCVCADHWARIIKIASKSQDKRH
jgi:hypothetical protein